MTETYSPTKRKRYAEEDMQAATFRLTNDGEIEEVRPSDTRRRDIFHESRIDEFKDNKRRTERKSRKPERRRRDDDTDEFDVKKLLKKLKDIID